MKFKKYIEYLDEDYTEYIRNLNLQNIIKNELFTEAKQVGTIYHFTEPVWMENIIKSGVLNLGKEKYTSFTRNASLPDESGYFNKPQYSIRLSFDGDKMSENLKISPIKDSRYEDESEEDVLKRVHLKYLKQIDIKPNHLYNRKMLEYILDICKKYNIKCNFVTKWSTIK